MSQQAVPLKPLSTGLFVRGGLGLRDISGESEGGATIRLRQVSIMKLYCS